MTKQSMSTQVKEQLWKLQHATLAAGYDPDTCTQQTNCNTTKAAILALIDTYVTQVIGEDYAFERPKEDYLPNVYIHLKAKNELRAVQRNRYKELRDE